MSAKILTDIAVAWAVRSFGHAHVRDFGTRSLRVAEEAVELAQAAGLPKEKLLDLVEIVYSRPVGSINQELGGVMLTTAVLSGIRGFTYQEAFEHELYRVLDKPPEHFAKRNQEKLNLGLKA